MHLSQRYTPPKAVAGSTAQSVWRQVGFSTGQRPAGASLASRRDSLLNSKARPSQESSALRTTARLGIGLAIGNLAAVRSMRRGCKALPGDADLPPSVCRTRLAGTEIVIIGTAHISAKSGAEVEELISAFEPDCIVVELDADRINAMFARPDGMNTSQIELQLEKTRNGFMKVVSQNEQLANAEDQKIIVVGPEPGEVRELPMRKALSEPAEDKTWFETAFKKHRYTSYHIKIEPATQLLSELLSSSLYPRLKHALYQCTGSVKQTGSEFVSAAHCARRLGCPIVLGDVKNNELFDPMGCLDATRDESLFARLVGPLVRPGPDSGIDFTKALNHVLGEFTHVEEESKASHGLTPRLWALFLITHVLPILSAAAYDGYFDGRYTPDVLLAGAIGGGFAFLFMEGLAVSILVFLLTAVRDLQLFRALAEAAEASKAKRVVLVCGVAHVNGVARRISKTTGSKIRSRKVDS